MSSSPLAESLRVPVEVLERILFFAFAPSKSSLFLPYSLTFDAKHPPPPLVTPSPNATHLLRISSGILQLSLPLFWHSLTIGSSSDWSLFFNPKDGLLVGKAFEVRRSWIEEVRINFYPHSQIPYDLDTARKFLRGEGTPDRFLVELEAVVLPNLRRIVFFEGRLEVGGCFKTKNGEATPTDPDDWYQHDHPLRELEYEWPGEMREARLAPYVRECQKERGLGSDASDDEGSIEDEALERHLEALGMYDEEEEQEWIFSQIQIDALQTRRLTTLPLFANPSHSSQHTYEATLDLFEDVYGSELIAWRTNTIQTSTFICLPAVGRDPNLVENWSRTVDLLKWASTWIPFQFVGFGRSFWEHVRRRPENPWGEEWTWRNEEGKVELLKDAFVHEALTQPTEEGEEDDDSIASLD